MKKEANAERLKQIRSNMDQWRAGGSPGMNRYAQCTLIVASLAMCLSVLLMVISFRDTGLIPWGFSS